MSPRRQRPQPAPRQSRRWILPAAIAVVLMMGLLAFLVLTRPGEQGQTAWARLGTNDAHSLAFVDGNPNRVLFGHHGGLLSSADGGVNWSALAVGQDAMSMAPAGDSSIVIAGHEVFAASRDSGATWTPVSSDLPSLDIHGFARDPQDPGRMWAYLATGGLWESVDYGVHWSRVRDDNVAFPIAVRDPSLRLIGVDTTGLVSSDDDGRTWASLVTPAAYPLTALAATQDGTVIYAGSTDGLFRSDDAGRSWTRTNYKGSAFAIATSPDGQAVAIVSREANFFRSPDGGLAWPGST